MKKFIRIISVIIACAIVSLNVCACSSTGAPDFDTSNPAYVQNVKDDITTELEAFLTECPDRTTFNSGEELAAEYLAARLNEYGYADVTVQDFTIDEGNVKNLSSQNVIARLKGEKSDGQKHNVVLGAYYDNRYSPAYNNARSFRAEAALAGGSGVASLLATAKYLVDNYGKEDGARLPYDVTIAFFGASYIYSDGASEFLRTGLTADERKNTVLMVEMQRLGCDYVYAYSDARETKREAFFDGIAKDNGLAIYKQTQRSPLISGTSVTDGIPYFQWVHSGVFAVFADAKIPTLNLMGGNWESMNLGDAESTTHENFTYSANDTLANLKKYHPDYADKMACAVTLVIKALENPQFVETMQYDKQNYPNTDILTTQWVWYLIVIGVLAIVFVIVYAVTVHLAKKYRPEAPKPRRMKMAVFGMDYEDKNSADIFIDIKSAEDIFPGIPNNDAAPKTRTDDIFPPHPASNRQEVDPRPTEPENPFDIPVDISEEKPAEATKIDKPAVEVEQQQAEEPIQESEPTKDVKDEAVPEKPAPKKRTPSKKAEPKIEIADAAKKRATVSAKKSVGAKKSTAAGKGKTENSEEHKKDGDK